MDQSTAHSIDIVVPTQTTEATDTTGAAPIRLDRFLTETMAKAVTGMSRARIQSLITARQVHLLTADGEAAGTILSASTKVKPGQRYRITVPPPEAATPMAQDIPLNVVFEDAHLIVIDKPAGLVVHPAPGNPDRTLVNALLAHCGESLQGIGGIKRPGIVHRLDKDTSGLMVAAKSQEAHTGLADLFAAHTLDRGYMALVWGSPSTARGTIDAPIGRSPHNRKKMAVIPRGKAAMTHYKRLKSYGATRPAVPAKASRGGKAGKAGEALVNLLECRLETGRTHQIRVHLTHFGHPVLGDPLYGRGRANLANKLSESARAALQALGRQALHAYLLGFEHPITGQKLRFESPLPPDMAALVSALETA